MAHSDNRHGARCVAPVLADVGNADSVKATLLLTSPWTSLELERQTAMYFCIAIPAFLNTIYHLEDYLFSFLFLYAFPSDNTKLSGGYDY